MANENITQLPQVVSATTDDIIYAIQGGVDVQETLGQVASLMLSSTVLSNAGDPNGSVAGVFKQLLWDTTNNFFWVCATAGTTTTAVWKPCIGAATNGQIPIGRTGNAPALGTITAGSNIAVTNGSGSITVGLTGVVPVANGGTNASSAGITAFNNITGYTASGATGTTSTNIVFSTSPTLVTPALGAASATSLSFSSTSGIIGTTTNNSAAAGSVGELISNSLASSGSVISLTNDTAADILTISLTAGDWDVSGLVGFKFNNGVTTYTNIEGWISATSATAPADYLISQQSSAALTAAGLVSFSVPVQRISIAAPTTVYLSGKASFAVSTAAAYGYIYARRIR